MIIFSYRVALALKIFTASIFKASYGFAQLDPRCVPNLLAEAIHINASSMSMKVVPFSNEAFPSSFSFCFSIITFNSNSTSILLRKSRSFPRICPLSINPIYLTSHHLRPSPFTKPLPILHSRPRNVY